MKMRRPAVLVITDFITKVSYKQNSCEALDVSSQLFLCFILLDERGVS